MPYFPLLKLLSHAAAEYSSVLVVVQCASSCSRCRGFTVPTTTIPSSPYY